MPIIGRTGEVQFRREASYSQTLERTAINVTNNRLEGLSGLIATGDRVRISGDGGIPLDRNGDGYADSPSGHAMYSGAGFSQGPRTDHRTSGSATFYENGADSSTFYDTSDSTGLTTTFDCYISVNELGYGRLHSSFADAVNGANALTLFDETTPFSIAAIQNFMNIVGDVTSYTLNTSRQNLDVDAIGEVFGESLAGKVTGSGSINCFFTFKDIGRRPRSIQDPVTTEDATVTTETDPVTVVDESTPVDASTQYIYELALRTAQGQDGAIRLYINKGDVGQSIYYASDIVITQSALNVQPDQIVAGTIDFVTSGPIALKVE